MQKNRILQYSSSEEKGQAFEHFVKDVIFPKEKYDLIHQTHDFTQNKNRYIEDSKNPDFIFRCLKSKKEFHVEAKYRSGFDSNNKLKTIEFHQFNRYKSLETFERPVLLIIGFEGSASNPKNISLIPIRKLMYLEAYWSFLKNFKIENIALDNDKLIEILNDYNSDQITQPTSPVQPIQNYENRTSVISKRKWILAMFVLAFLTISVFFLSKSSSKSDLTNQQTEDLLKNQIGHYYKDLENNNVEVLDQYINQRVDNWYSLKNVSLSEIKKETILYFKIYPKRSVNINWDSFHSTKLKNGDYSVIYDMIYKIKTKSSRNYRIYNLRISAIWDKNLKLKSIYEERI